MKMKYKIILLCLCFSIAHFSRGALALSFVSTPVRGFQKPLSNQFKNSPMLKFSSEKPSSTRVFCVDGGMPFWAQLKETLQTFTSICSLACIIPPTIYSIFDFLINVTAVKNSNVHIHGGRTSSNLFFCCGGGQRRLIRCASKLWRLSKPYH